MIKNIRISNWRQFGNIDIDFDNTLTVLTGANGAGKTTILDIISYLFGFNYSYTSVPKRSSNGELSYFNSNENNKFLEVEFPESYEIIGELSYIANRSR